MLRSLLIACALACAGTPAFAFSWSTYQGRTIQGYARAGGEKSLSPKLRGVISLLRAQYGSGAVRNVGGARSGSVAGRPGMASCHNGGHAFDAHLSAAARRYVAGRRDLGVITYSGRMSHVHVSD